MAEAADPADLIHTIQEALPTVTAEHVADLVRLSGYAYEAFVMVAVGHHLLHHDFDWAHPNLVIQFSTSGGRAIDDVLRQLSHLVGPMGHRVLPSLRWVGASGVTHALDLAAVHGRRALHAFGECKNTRGGPEIEIARGMVAIAAETWTALGFGPRRSLLISAQPATGSAPDLLRHWGGLAITLRPPVHGQPPDHDVRPPGPCGGDCPICNVLHPDRRIVCACGVVYTDYN